MENIAVMFVTAEVSQEERSQSKEVAPANMCVIFVTAEVSQEEMTSSKDADADPSSTNDISVTAEVFHSLIGPCLEIASSVFDNHKSTAVRILVSVA
jgi:hypothetical protein